MTTNRKYKSDVYEAIHSAAAGLYRAGTLDKETMRRFEDSCLTVLDTIELEPIKLVCESHQVSQPVRPLRSGRRGKKTEGNGYQTPHEPRRSMI